MVEECVVVVVFFFFRLAYMVLSRPNLNLHAMVIDLFSLYVLYSHFRPRDASRGTNFFEMSSYARANVRITN